MIDATDQFRAAMRSAGLQPPDELEADSKLHRFQTNGKNGDDAGWYVLHVDGVPAGAFGDWRTGASEVWRADIGRKLSRQEEAQHRTRLTAMRRERAAEEAKRKAGAREKATAIWQAARSAPDDHIYLRTKRIKAHGLRILDGALVVPMRDGAELHSLQFIDGDGSKRFLPGGRVSGCYFPIGKPDGVLCIAEGYATGATIHEATGYAVAVAFNAGNLLPVARALRKKFPELPLILCADDDIGTQGNPGLSKSREAAQAVNGLIAVPNFGDRRPKGATDFNDLAQHMGADSVRACIERAERIEAATRAADVDAVLERAVLVRGDTIKPEPITWLWPDWIAAAKLHILAGAPGTGKTTLALGLAAAVTCGGVWPDRTRATAGDVVMWSGEDSPEDVLIPRALAMGADTARLHIVQGISGPGGRRPYDPAHDTAALAEALRDLPNGRLLIVDPIVSAVAGDSHHNAETRRSLQPLVDLAQSHGCALLGITHLSKGSAGRDPVERVTGSLAFGALARVVLMAAREQSEDDKPGRRLLVRAKSNIGPDSGGFAYDLVQGALPGYPGVVASSVRWGVAVEGTARELMAQAEQVEDNTADDSKDFLRNLLADGPLPAKEVYAEAEGAGYSRDTMKRAKARLGVTARKQGMSGGWLWRLPNAEGRTEGSEEHSLSSVLPSRPSGPGALPSGADGVEIFEV